MKPYTGPAKHRTRQEDAARPTAGTMLLTPSIFLFYAATNGIGALADEWLTKFPGAVSAVRIDEEGAWIAILDVAEQVGGVPMVTR